MGEDTTPPGALVRFLWPNGRPLSCGVLGVQDGAEFHQKTVMVDVTALCCICEQYVHCAC